jgi:hypothetical protein
MVPQTSRLRYINREHRAELIFAFETGIAIEEQIAPRFIAAGFTMKACSAAFSDQGRICTMRYEVRWHTAQAVHKALDLVHEFGGSHGVTRIEWQLIAPW